MLVPLIVLMVLMGLFPGPVLRKMDAAVARSIETLRGRPAAVMNLPAKPSPPSTIIPEPER